MDSLDIYAQLPVNPSQYYLVGLQVYGVPGFDFLSPIGTSGVTIAAALNPCVGEQHILRCLDGSIVLSALIMGCMQHHPCSYSILWHAGDYSFAFAGLSVGIDVPTPVDIQVDLALTLNQLAFSKSGAIDPAVYPNLAVTSTFWTPG